MSAYIPPHKRKNKKNNLVIKQTIKAPHAKKVSFKLDDDILIIPKSTVEDIMGVYGIDNWYHMGMCRIIRSGYSYKSEEFNEYMRKEELLEELNKFYDKINKKY